MKCKKLTRRDFIRRAALAGAGLALGSDLLSKLDASAQGGKIYLPLILKAPGPPPAGVVHVHDSDATDWNFSSGWYGSYVDQATVDNMVDQGVMALTGASTVADAWRALIPSYTSGEGVAIKVNFNNAGSCTDSDNVIDALPHPVLSVIAGLLAIGVNQADIWIYDAIRPIPSRFKSVITAVYPNVRFYDSPPCSGSLQATFSSADPSAWVTFSQGIASQRVADVVVEAAHLINIPIMKRHFYNGTTLSFKNHFGTIPNPGALHDYIDVDGGPPYSSTQNPLVDIYLNPNIGAKTRLVLGDGLFGALDFNQAPVRWSTFGNQAPNSLLFATDPVAIDCVMYDLLDAERAITLAGADDYLQVAQAAGLGTFEHCSSPGVYSQIGYVQIEL